MLRCVQFLSFPFHIVSVQSKASNHSNQVASLIAVPAVITSSSTSTPTLSALKLGPFGLSWLFWPLANMPEV
jgi:hypothetical protein